jgi:hypothetical protein
MVLGTKHPHLLQLVQSLLQALILITCVWVFGSLEGLPCEFEGVIASPMIDGYRNKCEFSIGSGPDGKRVVGFQLGTFRCLGLTLLLLGHGFLPLQ